MPPSIAATEAVNLIQPAVIFINGLPAVGKHTIARHNRHMLNPSKGITDLMNRESNSTLLHNHLIIDLAAATAPWHDTPAHVGLRQQLLAWTLKALRDQHDAARTYLITAHLAIDPERKRKEELMQYIEFAEAKGLPFFWFHLTCSDEKQHLKRLVHVSRHHGKTKDTAKLLHERKDQNSVQLTPIIIEDSLTDHHAIASRYHTIDTAHRKAHDVAQEILAIVANDSRSEKSEHVLSDPAVVAGSTRWSTVKATLMQRIRRLHPTANRP